MNKLPFFFEMNPKSYRYLYRHPKPFFMLFIQNSFTQEDLLIEYEKCGSEILFDQQLPLSYCEINHPNGFC